MHVQVFHPLRESEKVVAGDKNCPFVEDLLCVLNERFVGQNVGSVAHDEESGPKVGEDLRVPVKR